MDLPENLKHLAPIHEAQLHFIERLKHVVAQLKPGILVYPVNDKTDIKPQYIKSNLGIIQPLLNLITEHQDLMGLMIDEVNNKEE